MNPNQSQQNLGRLEWKPNRKQEIFLALPDTIKEAFYGGGAGRENPTFYLFMLLREDGIRILASSKYFNVELILNSNEKSYLELRKSIQNLEQHIITTDMAWTFPREDQIWRKSLRQYGGDDFLRTL